MKSFKSVLVLGALLATGVAHADAQLSCTSYSNEYDFQITVGAGSARVDVLRADTVGRDFILKRGQSIALAPEQQRSADWLIFEGIVQGEQTLGLNVSKTQLESPTPTLFLSISRLDTSAEALSVQVECTKSIRAFP